MRSFNSNNEFKRVLFANDIIKRLEETLCDKLGIEIGQSKLSVQGRKPNTGFIELERTEISPPITEDVSRFYESEGYLVQQRSESFLEVQKDNIHYWANVYGNRSTYHISIIVSPLQKLIESKRN
jgi:hypothetical protein